MYEQAVATALRLSRRPGGADDALGPADGRTPAGSMGPADPDTPFPRFRGVPPGLPFRAATRLSASRAVVGRPCPVSMRGEHRRGAAGAVQIVDGA
ncbi:hypothetical protein ACQPZF_14800 [Actinosynnema sp. CS-041913]|uniref:hypothetical protein n=1 Tax=Actinosynnema sp. CS-041913 TaxID=3239917 RepID=UPI003D934192